MKTKKQQMTIPHIYAQDEKGTLLFLVLFLVSALMVAGAVLLQNSFTERTIAGNYELKIRAHYIAETGAEVAMSLLNKQPDYFLQRTGIDNPVYLKRGEEEEYFVLEWLEPGNPEGSEQYYTLISSGYYRHAVKRKEAIAVLRAFVELIFDLSEDNGENGENGDSGAEDAGGTICGENGDGYSGGENSSAMDDGSDFEEGKNFEEETAIEARIISWSGW